MPLLELFDALNGEAKIRQLPVKTRHMTAAPYPRFGVLSKRSGRPRSNPCPGSVNLLSQRREDAFR